MTGDLSATTSFFSNEAEPFASNYQKNPCFRDRLNLFIRAVQQSTPRGGKVLDFGCGPGVIALTIAQLGYEVLGLDGSAGMVQTARTRAQTLKVHNARFQHTDVAQFDSGIGTFDAVVCSSVIEYIEDDIGLLERLIACIRPGGNLFVSVPHGANVFAPIEPLAHLIKLRLKRQREGHLAHTLHHYSRNLLLRQIQAMGLEELRCTFFECPILGEVGIKLSRLQFLSRMLLIEGRKGLASSQIHNANGTPK